MSAPKRLKAEAPPSTTTTTTTTAPPPQPLHGLGVQQVFIDQNSGCRIKIVNVVATANLGRTLDLYTIAMHARKTEFNPDKFNALVVRFDQPASTGLVFSSGKIVVTGVKSEVDASNACKRIAVMIKKIGNNSKPAEGPELKEFKVQNIVAHADLGWPIQLEHFAFEQSSYCSYEPEIFPGLIYRMIDPKLVVLCFVTGKVVLTGAKFQEDILDAFAKLYPLIQGYKKSRYTTAGGVVDSGKLLPSSLT